jgi:hypothetical protein
LQEGRKNANIDAGLGFIWRVSVKRRAQEVQINRRDLIGAGAAGAAVVTISGSALAQTSHEHHAAPSSLFDAASNCVKAGLVCSDHCLQAFAAGDTSLAACARAVDEMMNL